MEEIKEEKRRTLNQNRALHLYFQMLADELNRAGLDMKVVLKPSVDIWWNKQTIKDYLWRPIMKAQLGKRSTTEMTTTDIDAVFDTLNRHLSDKFGKWCEAIPFPSLDQMMNQLENQK